MKIIPTHTPSSPKNHYTPRYQRIAQSPIIITRTDNDQNSPSTVGNSPFVRLFCATARISFILMALMREEQPGATCWCIISCCTTGCHRWGDGPNIRFAIRRARPTRHEFNIRNNIRTCFDTAGTMRFSSAFTMMKTDERDEKKGSALFSRNYWKLDTRRLLAHNEKESTRGTMSLGMD